MKWTAIMKCGLVLLCAGSVCAETGIIRLYLDADQTGARASGVSIEQGIRTALNEVGGQAAGYALELVVLDHRGNIRRSKRHLDQYLEDDRALAVFSGLHSPPLLAHRDFINENQILVLDPWAAAGPITRYPSPTNWIFRLSIDDSNAGVTIAKHAVDRGFKKPGLLLEETGWGKSNEKTMMQALSDLGCGAVLVEWFKWGMGEAQARSLLRRMAEAGVDVIFFVGNTREGNNIAKAMVSLPPEMRLPICSHWGITGGDFPQVVDAGIREKLDLTFIQTAFSFISSPENERGKRVLIQARALFPDEIRDAADIRAPTGFIHAYDLTLLLVAAIEQQGLTGDVLEDRARIRSALEQLRDPVEGLVKTYQTPFSVFSEENPDAHEALGVEDYRMGYYGPAGEIILVDHQTEE